MIGRDPKNYPMTCADGFLQWRGDMRVTPSDRVWWRSISHYIRNEDSQLPPTGRFNYGQKLFTWGMFYSTILMLLSGLVLWFTGDLPWVHIDIAGTAWGMSRNYVGKGASGFGTRLLIELARRSTA